jgi:hypothetical protein
VNIDWMLFLYGIGAIAVGIFIFREDLGPTFLVKRKDQRLGPCYWGVYADASTTESASEQLIVPPKPCKDIDGLAGSGAYAGGKAIHTAKT